MLQVSWLGQINTSVPITLAQVCAWVAVERPDLVRRPSSYSHLGPSAAEVEAFMTRNRHFQDTLVFIYAQEHGLLPAAAVRPRP